MFHRCINAFFLTAFTQKNSSAKDNCSWNIYIFILTFKTLGVCLTHGSGGTWRQLTPLDFLTASPCRIRWATACEIIPHGVAHTSIQAGIDLEEILTIIHYSTYCPFKRSRFIHMLNLEEDSAVLQFDLIVVCFFFLKLLSTGLWGLSQTAKWFKASSWITNTHL